ncbi:DNA polymerase III subunit gamma and tau [Corynebacterium casei]|uniref:DNA polymerase III subunit gamma and tau n=1 Tax=Corynebacterium casei TaxID=160386 RepID=UPI000EF00EC0|nr:DNA polymerase III subunit gamma and tau [Corynebacterium casei]HCJ68113.1 DNA polymerase III subunit gamma/tau [Corynebacterium casei]
MALYRKYRPATFAEVVGQEQVTQPLSAALDSGRINHAYLFSGPRGCGKTSSARIMARSLNCVQGPTSTPCGECASCVSLAPGGPGNLDVTELDAASHNSVEDMRELRERAYYAPADSRYRIFIIDEAHMVTNQGFNALLKIVEEPPEHLIFIFATTEPDKVIGTIRSRTHHYPFRLLTPPAMKGLLERTVAAEGLFVEDSVYPMVIAAGGGSPRDTLSILDQLLAGSGPNGLTYDIARPLLGVTDVTLLDDTIAALAQGDKAALFKHVDSVIEAGHEPRRFAVDLLERLRDLMILQAVPDAIAAGLVDAPVDRGQTLTEQAQLFNGAQLAHYAATVNEQIGALRGATSPRLLLEILCAHLVMAPTSTDVAASSAPAQGTPQRNSQQAGQPGQPGQSGQSSAAASGSSSNNGATGLAAAQKAVAEIAARRGQKREQAQPGQQNQAGQQQQQRQPMPNQPAQHPAQQPAQQQPSQQQPAQWQQPEPQNAVQQHTEQQTQAQAQPAPEQSASQVSQQPVHEALRQASAQQESHAQDASDESSAWQPEQSQNEPSASETAESAEPVEQSQESQSPAEPVPTTAPGAEPVAEQSAEPVAEPAGEATPAAAASDPDELVEQLRNDWQRLRASVSKRNKIAGIMLTEARVLGLKDDTLILGHTTGALAERLNAPANNKDVVAVVSEEAGRQLAVNCIVGTNPEAAGFSSQKKKPETWNPNATSNASRETRDDDQEAESPRDYNNPASSTPADESVENPTPQSSADTEHDNQQSTDAQPAPEQASGWGAPRALGGATPGQSTPDQTVQRPSAPQQSAPQNAPSQPAPSKPAVEQTTSPQSAAGNAAAPASAAKAEPAQDWRARIAQAKALTQQREEELRNSDTFSDGSPLPPDPGPEEYPEYDSVPPEDAHQSASAPAQNLPPAQQSQQAAPTASAPTASAPPTPAGGPQSAPASPHANPSAGGASAGGGYSREAEENEMMDDAREQGQLDRRSATEVAMELLAKELGARKL